MRGSKGWSSKRRQTLTGAGVLTLIIGWLAFRTESPPVDISDPLMARPSVLHMPLRDELERCGTDQMNMRTLINWVRKNGGTVRNLVTRDILIPTDGSLDSWKSDHTYRGVFAAEPIPIDSVVAHIPSWLSASVLNPALTGPGTPLHWLLDSKEISSAHSRLALALIYERFRGGSFFAPYLCMMPKVVDAPLFWNDSKLKDVETHQHYKMCAKVKYQALYNATGVVPVAELTLRSKKSQAPPTISPGDLLSGRYKHYTKMYDLEVLATFECSPELHGVSDKVRQQRQSYRNSFKDYVPFLEMQHPELFPTGALTLDTWIWAHYHVRARTWGTEGESCMWPIMDMFNHDYDGNRLRIHSVRPNNITEKLRRAKPQSLVEFNWTDMDRTDGATYASHKNYKIGQEVIDSYGDDSEICNTHWLASYGFTLPRSNCYCDYSHADETAKSFKNEEAACSW